MALVRQCCAPRDGVSNGAEFGAEFGHQAKPGVTAIRRRMQLGEGVSLYGIARSR